MSESRDAAVSRRANVLLVLTALLGIVLFLVLRLILFNFYSIPSQSNEPTLFQGDYLLVSKFSYGFSRYSIPLNPVNFHGRILARPPRRGDMVVFKRPSDTSVDYIKRVIGLPGDHVQLKAGVVFINGRAMPRRPVGEVQTDLGGGDLVPADRFEETTP